MDFFCLFEVSYPDLTFRKKIDLLQIKKNQNVMLGFIRKIREKFRRKKEIKRANSDSAVAYYLHKTRSKKQESNTR